jgi:hypothetical protein
MLSCHCGLRKLQCSGVHETGSTSDRINGIDGKIELAKVGLRDLGAADDLLNSASETLGQDGFSKYKKYRDAVIHARILDAPTGIAISPAKRGKRQEVLITVNALNALYDRLVLVRNELIEICQITIRLYTTRRWGPMSQIAAQIVPNAGQIPGPPTRQIEQEIQEALSRYRVLRKRRQSLPPLPEFPDESSALPETESDAARSGLPTE